MSAPDASPLLTLPVSEAAGRYARLLCEQVDQAAARLVPLKDDEALHDFRVALRQLRTFLRAYRPHLSLDKALRRKLKKLAAGTNRARDDEVLLHWLRQQRRLGPKQRVGQQHFIQHLEDRLGTAHPGICRQATARWAKLGSRLHRALGRSSPSQAEENFSSSCARLVEAQSQHLTELLQGIAAEWEDAAVHEARIGGKRLRYLLEPFVQANSAADEAVSRLKRFQDQLGAYHDRTVALQRLAEFAQEAAADYTRELFAGLEDGPDLKDAQKQDPLAGLLTLAERTRIERLALQQTIREEYLDHKPGHFLLEPARRAAAQLAPPAAMA